MRKGWEYKKLGEVGQIVTGSTPSTKDESNYSPREYCFVKPSDLPSQGIADIEETEYYVSQVGLSKSRVLPAGSVLVSCIGSIGKIGILTKEACSNQQINAIIPQDETDSRFIAYSLYAQRFVLESIANAPVVPIINKTDFSKITIGIPPKSTQLSIVSELDKINELIRLKKEQLKDFDNLAQSIFYEMFGDPVENEKGWEVKKLKDIVSDNCSISYGIVQPGDGVENGVPVVRPVDMTKTFVSRKGLKNTTKEISESYKRTILKGNEILMCVRGTTGLISMATPELQGCNVTRGITPIECGPTCYKWFIFYQILNPAIQHHIAEYTKGIALKQINMKDVRDIPLCLPPLPLQHLFAQRIEQIEHQKAEVQKSITDLETLLASRMQYWFE